MDFPEWYDLFREECRSMGYDGSFDMDAASAYWTNNMPPGEAAFDAKPSTVHPDDAFMAGLREKYPNAKITRK